MTLKLIFSSSGPNKILRWFPYGSTVDENRWDKIVPMRTTLVIVDNESWLLLP